SPVPVGCRRLTMAAHGFARRRLLKALGLGAAAAPWHGLVTRSLARAATTPPLRLLLFCTGYGGRRGSLRPHGLSPDPHVAGDYALTRESVSYPDSSLAPLAPFVSQMTVIEGVSLTSGLLTNSGGARTLYIGHEGHGPELWTGTPLVNPGSATKT